MSKTTLRNIIVSLIMIFVSLGVFLFMVYFVTDQGARLEEQIIVLEGERAQELSYVWLQKLTEETKSDRQQLDGFFLSQESDSIDFLNQVETLAPKVNVSIETKSLKLVEDKVSDSEWIQSSFLLLGSRDEVNHFIKILETLPYISRIIHIEMSSLSNVEWQAEVIMQVRVLTYDK